MIATYEIERPVDILGEGPRVTLAAGRYSTSDAAVQRKIGHYPGIRLISLESENPAPCAGGEPAGIHRAAPPEVEVRNHCGIQFKEKRPIGGRVADVVDSD
jgi:hypothetical protein